jgi:hypothetical protein
MAATYDLATSIGKVRLRIPDRDIADPLFSDEEIQEFLTENGGNTYLAAAEAVETVAGDPQRLQHIQRGQVSETPQLAFNLRERAQSLRRMAHKEYDGIMIGELARGGFYGDDESEG